MSMFVAWVLYPLVLLVLCVGAGLLVDVLSGRRLPGALVPPVGLAAIVVVGQFTTLTDATAELTMPLACLLAVLGIGLSLPWRFPAPIPGPSLSRSASSLSLRRRLCSRGTRPSPATSSSTTPPPGWR